MIRLANYSPCRRIIYLAIQNLLQYNKSKMRHTYIFSTHIQNLAKFHRNFDEGFGSPMSGVGLAVHLVYSRNLCDLSRFDSIYITPWVSRGDPKNSSHLSHGHGWLLVAFWCDFIPPLGRFLLNVRNFDPLKKKRLGNASDHERKKNFNWKYTD